MRITATVDTAPVGTYYGQLAAMLKKTLPETIKFEAAATVRRAMLMQKSSKASEVKARGLKKGVASFREAGSFGGTTSVGKRSREFGRQWMVGLRGGGAKPMSLWTGGLNALADHTGQGWRVSDADWTRFKSLWAKDAKDTRDSIKARLGARGIAAKSWLEILYKLNTGNTDSVAAYITRARPISGKTREVAMAIESGMTTSQPVVTISNSSGVAIAAGGARKLASAITIRRNAFKNAFEKNLFFDAKFVARNYPWAKVT